MVKFKESESESDGAEHAAEPRFRVRVCMQRFYSGGDVRARAYVCVAPRRRVRWLQRRLRRLFALPPVRLLSRGYLLPPQEPLALLQPDDPVEVVPAEAEPEDTAVARDLVDSVDYAHLATVEELERSPPPVNPDYLTESKRQALSMLEQYCVEPAAGGATDAPRAKRRRVRRRRRVPSAAPCAGSDAEAAPAGSSAVQCAGVGSDSEAVPGSSSAAQCAGVGSDADSAPGSSSAAQCAGAGSDADSAPGSLSAAQCAGAGSDAEAAPASSSAAAREPGAAAMVLRNELQPRAPRIVRPLSDRTTVTSLDTSPAGFVTS